MASPAHDSQATDALVSSSAAGLAAANLLRAHWDELSIENRSVVLDLLVRRAEATSRGLEELSRSGGDHQDRIEALEKAAGVSRDRISVLEDAALTFEAAALVSDARILELATEVDRLLAAQDEANLIEEAKRMLMTMMDISEDAAFAVLVAASQRDDVPLHSIAQRIMAGQQRLS